MNPQADLVGAAVRKMAEVCVANGATFIVLAAVPDQTGEVTNIVRAHAGMDDSENRERMTDAYLQYMADIMHGKVTPNRKAIPNS